MEAQAGVVDRLNTVLTNELTAIKRNILEEMVRDEETHLDWLETQLQAIKQVGLENYLSQQLRS